MSLSIKRMIALTVALLVANLAQAEAPMKKEQAPGYYRTMLGNYEVTAISDGTVKLPVDDLLLNTTKKHVRETLADSFLSAPLATSVNTYLINTGDKLILIDAGAGSLFGPTLGFMVENLRAAGYSPEQVDEIYITHMHPDHVGGLVSDGDIVFPNAVVRAHQQDADYWLSKDNLEAAPKDGKGFFKGAMASLNPYVEAGQFKPFAKNEELAPGITASAAVGHTPGHTTYRVQSQGQTLMLWGDLIHVAAVQFPEPDVAIQFDVNSKTAVKSRAEAFADAREKGYLVGSAHLSFPGMGHLRSDGEGYEFIPVNYRTEL